MALFFQIYIGLIASNIAIIVFDHQHHVSTVQSAIHMIGFIALVVVTIFGTRVDRKMLNEEIPEI